MVMDDNLVEGAEIYAKMIEVFVFTVRHSNTQWLSSGFINALMESLLGGMNDSLLFKGCWDWGAI
jgi:hypothetical protein